jgi:hypothetical protein
VGSGAGSVDPESSAGVVAAAAAADEPLGALESVPSDVASTELPALVRTASVAGGLDGELEAVTVELVVGSELGSVATGVAVAVVEALPDVTLGVDGAGLLEEAVGVVGVAPPDERVDGLPLESLLEPLVVVGLAPEPDGALVGPVG